MKKRFQKMRIIDHTPLIYDSSTDKVLKYNDVVDLLNRLVARCQELEK